jgi:hypothetical protein
MSRKRRNTSSPEPDDGVPSPKRRDTQEAGSSYDVDERAKRETPYIDDLTGQTGAFPGLGTETDELFYGPARDGIDYLRMVRYVLPISLLAARALRHYSRP